MTHCTEEDLVLHLYADPAAPSGAADHVSRCAACAAALHDLQSVLDSLPGLEIPERNERYGLEVWQRLRPLIDAPQAGRIWWQPDWLSLRPAWAAAAAVLLLAAGFAGGRLWPDRAASSGPAVRDANAAAAGAAGARRVLLMSVADHLERSDRVLTDIMNAAEGVDISPQQHWAEDLLWTGRLYRQDAAASGEPVLAAVLDDLERTLLDVVHSPPTARGADLDALRDRVESAALLFKVRLMRDELQRPAHPATGQPVRRSQTS